MPEKRSSSRQNNWQPSLRTTPADREPRHRLPARVSASAAVVVVAVVASFSAARLTDTSKPTSVVTCIGLPLTAQLQVVPNTNYCGGSANQPIRLAQGDTWTDGSLAGTFSTGQQQGALSCADTCTLVNVSVGPVPNAFAAFYAPQSKNVPISIVGGHFYGAGSLGIGASRNQLTITGAEIDHNGGSADCGFEGGGIKGTGRMVLSSLNIHDNSCPGVWSDLGGSGSLENSQLTNNGSAGAFIEISHDWTISNDTYSGNGAKDGNGGCTWLWNGQITISTSYNVEIGNNTLSNSVCNGITVLEQSRTLDGATIQTRNVYVHDNGVDVGTGLVGMASDNHDAGVFDTSSNRFVSNHYAACAGSHFAWSGSNLAFADWQAIPQDAGATCGPVATQKPTPSAPLPTSSPTLTTSAAPLPSLSETITLANGQTCTIRVSVGVVSGSCY